MPDGVLARHRDESQENDKRASPMYLPLEIVPSQSLSLFTGISASSEVSPIFHLTETVPTWNKVAFDFLTRHL
jgi:hypothetical protein